MLLSHADTDTHFFLVRLCASFFLVLVLRCCFVLLLLMMIFATKTKIIPVSISISSSSLLVKMIINIVGLLRAKTHSQLQLLDQIGLDWIKYYQANQLSLIHSKNTARHRKVWRQRETECRSCVKNQYCVCVLLHQINT